MNSIIKIFERDLEKLKKEISDFNNENNLWITTGDVANSAGNLALHLIGNLKFFVGNVIGNSGYNRERDKEFSLKFIPTSDLLVQIDETKEIVKSSLDSFPVEQLDSVYPIDVLKYKMSYEYFLIHLLTHLNYHIGQINYLRRVLDL